MGKKVIVYGVKGNCLWGKIVYGEKVIVYGEAFRNLLSAQTAFPKTRHIRT